jgi:purine-binding chemotaxis protein CheW
MGNVIETHAPAAERASDSRPEEVASSPLLRGGEFLTCRLGAEEYGIEILRVQEIRSYETPTRMAGAPAHVLGVLNLRGLIVPVLDLRLKFGCPAQFNASTVVVVLRLADRTVGVVVDAVSDVLRLEAKQISPLPALGGSTGSNGVVGICSVEAGDDRRMLLLLDVEQAVGGTEFATASAQGW